MTVREVLSHVVMADADGYYGIGQKIIMTGSLDEYKAIVDAAFAFGKTRDVILLAATDGYVIATNNNWLTCELFDSMQ